MTIKFLIQCTNTTVQVYIDGVMKPSQAKNLYESIKYELDKQGCPQIIEFIQKGKLEITEEGLTTWNILLESLKHSRIKLARFVFDKENTAYRYFTAEVAHHYQVPVRFDMRL